MSKFRAHQTLPLRLVRRLPKPLILAPERVVINFALALIGLGVLFTQPQPGSVLANWTPWLLYGWALAMVFGGTSVLWGMFKRNTTVERLGYLLIGPSCLAYGLDLIVDRGFIGLTSGLIFLALALCKAIRMVLSSAARDTVIELGKQMDRDDSERDSNAAEMRRRDTI